MNSQKGFINIIVIIGVVILAGVAGYFAVSQRTPVPISLPTPIPNNPSATPTPNPNPIVCTKEAKQCSDGSYVSRTGRNCEFAKCPTITPTPTSNSQKIIKKVGEQEGSFLIQKINANNVDGLWYQAYPVAREEGTLKTIRIGDDIGYACEGVSEKLTSINYSGQTITFTKVVGQAPYGGCPI